MYYLIKCCLTTDSHGVDAILVKTSRGRNGGIVVHTFSAIDSPIIIAKIVYSSVATIENQTIFARLVIKGTIDTLFFLKKVKIEIGTKLALCITYLIEFITVLFIRVNLNSIWFRAILSLDEASESQKG